MVSGPRRNRMKRFGQLKEKETHDIGVTRGTSMKPSDRASYPQWYLLEPRVSDFSAGTTGGNTIVSPADVRRRTHRSRVTADGNGFRWCAGFAVVRVESSLWKSGRLNMRHALYRYSSQSRHSFTRQPCLPCLPCLPWAMVGALTAPTSMALRCRWRSRPQHQYRTHAAAANSIISAASLRGVEPPTASIADISCVASIDRLSCRVAKGTAGIEPTAGSRRA